MLYSLFVSGNRSLRKPHRVYCMLVSWLSTMCTFTLKALWGKFGSRTVDQPLGDQSNTAYSSLIVLVRSETRFSEFVIVNQVRSMHAFLQSWLVSL